MGKQKRPSLDPLWHSWLPAVAAWLKSGFWKYQKTSWFRTSVYRGCWYQFRAEWQKGPPEVCSFVRSANGAFRCDFAACPHNSVFAVPRSRQHAESRSLKSGFLSATAGCPDQAALALHDSFYCGFVVLRLPYRLSLSL